MHLSTILHENAGSKAVPLSEVEHIVGDAMFLQLPQL